MWCFFQLDLAIKNALFFAQAGRRKFGRASHNSSDSFSKWFGTIVPANIPDSTAWWRRQARELGAICDDTECGLMQSMVTITSARPPGDCFIINAGRVVFNCSLIHWVGLGIITDPLRSLPSFGADRSRSQRILSSLNICLHACQRRIRAKTSRSIHWSTS